MGDGESMIARMWQGWASPAAADEYQRHYESEVAEHLQHVAGRGRLVERWFGLLTDKQLRRGVHKNLQALERDIRDWIWNDNSRPFTWTNSADDILERLAAY